jgi:CRISPR/Cas system-associated exonuclease Cas4 (RecB family)
VTHKPISAYAFASNKEIWSVSKINTYLLCPRQFQFKSVLKVPEVKKYYLTRGNIFHDVVAELLRNMSDDILRDLHWYENLIDEMFDTKKFENEPVMDERTPECNVRHIVKLAFKAWFNYLENKNLSIPNYSDSKITSTPAIELEFRIPLVKDNISVDLLGFVDQIIVENGLVIMDHKLHSGSTKRSDLDTGIQLPVYAYAVNFLVNNGCFDPVLNVTKVGYNSFKIKKTKVPSIEFEVWDKTICQDDINNTITKVIDVISEVKQNNFCPNFGSHCNFMCSYRTQCQEVEAGKPIESFSRTWDFDTEI